MRSDFKREFSAARGALRSSKRGYWGQRITHVLYGICADNSTENSPGGGGGVRGLLEGLAALRGSESRGHRRSSWLAEDKQITPPDQGDSRGQHESGQHPG